jgi:hypothetical protein
MNNLMIQLQQFHQHLNAGIALYKQTPQSLQQFSLVN